MRKTKYAMIFQFKFSNTVKKTWVIFEVWKRSGFSFVYIFRISVHCFKLKHSFILKNKIKKFKESLKGKS